MNYYNDNDPFAAKWLKKLVENKLVPLGEVDDRDIREIKPSELKVFKQCHFFSGIAGWSYALMLSDWPEDRPVWTGSCPCQPFSVAGQSKGVNDERHLWPAFRWLIAQCRPPAIFGEQVASKAGREWLTGVRTDLEAMGYAVGAADLCAAGIGAPHIRQRLWWVADAENNFRRTGERSAQTTTRPNKIRGQRLAIRGDDDGMAYTGNAGGGTDKPVGEPEGRASYWGDSAWIQCIDKKQRRIPVEPALFPLAPGLSGRVGLLRGIGNSIVPQVAAEFIKAYLWTISNGLKTLKKN